MDKQTAIDLAGSRRALCEILDITRAAVSAWGDQIPKSREYELRVKRPEWFSGKPIPSSSAGPASTQPAPVVQTAQPVTEEQGAQRETA